MKSYYEAHELAYKQIKSNGYVGWGNKEALDKLVDSATAKYLQDSIQQWMDSEFAEKKALDLGCGTGSTAFTMARLGLAVTGVDISSTAIELARNFASEQNLDVDFRVDDILQLEKLDKKFDVIYDSHCLHCIVFEEDRKAVFTGVKNSLSRGGIFILHTAVLGGAWDPTHPYETLRFDENYILWHKTPPSDAHGVIEFEGQHWCAQRRFYPASKVLEEVEQAGFKILSQDLDSSNEGGGSWMLRLVLR